VGQLVDARYLLIVSLVVRRVARDGSRARRAEEGRLEERLARVRVRVRLGFGARARYGKGYFF